MTRRLLLLFAVMTASMFAQNRVFELRTYVANEGKFEALKTRFRDHTIRIFARHGMESIGYWIPQDPEKSKNTLTYIIAHTSREQATKNWVAFRADPEWQKVAAESEKNGKILQSSPTSCSWIRPTSRRSSNRGHRAPGAHRAPHGATPQAGGPSARGRRS